MSKKEAAVTVNVELGALKAKAQRAARKSGIGLNEFVCNALESRIRQEREWSEPESFVRHGGKHLFGKHTGYEVTKDGSYYPAPSWTQQFNTLFAERQAIYDLVNSIVARSQERLIAVEVNIDKAKARLIDDLGLDPSLPWAYYSDGDGGRLIIVPDKKPDEGTS